MQIPINLVEHHQNQSAKECNPSLSALPPTLTEAARESIITRLTECPDEVTTYYESINAETNDRWTECHFGAIRRAGRWEVWSLEVDPEDGDGLIFSAAYLDYETALSAARDWAAATAASAECDLAYQKDAVWEQHPIPATGLAGPFRFSDNTDFADGWEMEDEEGVFAFFRKHDALFRPEEWGNLYACSLHDHNGILCWVAVNHRDEMRLYEE